MNDDDLKAEARTLLDNAEVKPGAPVSATSIVDAMMAKHPEQQREHLKRSSTTSSRPTTTT